MHKLIKTVAVAAAALGLIALPSAAQASNPEPAASAKAVTYATLPLPANVIGEKQITANSVGWLDMGSQIRAEIRAAQVKTPEAYGVLTEPTALAPKVITNLGGKYFGDDTSTSDDRYTVIGSFRLKKGTWLVNTSVTFHRDAAGAAGSRPQVGLRIGQNQDLAGDAKWGRSVGTVGGADISPAKGHDLFGSTVSTVELPEETEVVVYGFGYNDDQSDAGSGQITASVNVAPVRVG